MFLTLHSIESVFAKLTMFLIILITFIEISFLDMYSGRSEAVKFSYAMESHAHIFSLTKSI